MGISRPSLLIESTDYDNNNIINFFKQGQISYIIVYYLQDMYWYIGRDVNGKKGMIPGNFLKPFKGIQ